MLFTEKKIKGLNIFEASFKETSSINQKYDVVYNKKTCRQISLHVIIVFNYIQPNAELLRYIFSILLL